MFVLTIYYLSNALYRKIFYKITFYTHFYYSFVYPSTIYLVQIVKYLYESPFGVYWCKTSGSIEYILWKSKNNQKTLKKNGTHHAITIYYNKEFFIEYWGVNVIFKKTFTVGTYIKNKTYVYNKPYVLY